jgi:hypothetical protein
VQSLRCGGWERAGRPGGDDSDDEYDNRRDDDDPSWYFNRVEFGGARHEFNIVKLQHISELSVDLPPQMPNTIQACYRSDWRTLPAVWDNRKYHKDEKPPVVQSEPLGFACRMDIPTEAETNYFSRLLEKVYCWWKPSTSKSALKTTS